MEHMTIPHRKCNILKNVRVTAEHLGHIERGESLVVVLPLDGRTKGKVGRWRTYAALRRMRRLENVVELVADGSRRHYLFSYNWEDFLMTPEAIDGGEDNPCRTMVLVLKAKVSFA